MRTFFITLLAAVLAISPVHGQGAAAAPEMKPSAGPSTLTKEERARAVDYLTESQKDFVAAIDGLSEEQWKWKAAPDRWSIAETAEHIAFTEDMIWKLVSEKIMKSPADPEKKEGVKGKEEMIMKMIPDRSRKAQAPEQLRPTGKWTTRASLVKDFDATREAEIAFVKETKEDLRSHFEEHPFLKTMDAYQWLLFNGAHNKRHTAQILEVKAEAGFPKN
ncbi:MAG: DinB family protein [Chthoniobacterales bacterium]|nr:DinB family protein [Chthoniobacterales bacterium]